jgi:hypothetical protein
MEAFFAFQNRLPPLRPLHRPGSPVFCQVGIARVVPTDGIGYDPTDGALTAPYPDVPACATGAAALGMASAAASAIVVIFMAMSFL